MSPHPSRRALARALAGAFLAGTWEYEALIARAADTLDPAPPWLAHLARAVLVSHPRAPRDEPRVLGRMIELELRNRRYRQAGAPWPRVRRWLGAYTEMAFRRWPVPVLDDVGALGELLALDQSQLAWMADVKSLERTARDERLRHYRYLALPRPGGPVRVIEAPKPRLKAIQRRLLHELLDWIPAHPAAHGFTRGRSAISHAAVHSARHAILRIDLEDFFASVPAGRVYAIFRSAGYPEAVAHTLTGLTTNTVSRSAWHAIPRPTDRALIAPHHRLGRRLAVAHLPQGAPTSPALPNLAAFGLDRRLAALADSLELHYTRYADDIVFSGGGGLRSRAAGVRSLVAQIASDEGFRINPRKTALLTQAVRQQVCGIIVNHHPALSRAEYDRLRAILHRCARDGPTPLPGGTVEDLRAHLLGRIAWVQQLGGPRADRLRAQFAQIDWTPDRPAPPQSTS
jgi:hypothetical protein